MLRQCWDRRERCRILVPACSDLELRCKSSQRSFKVDVRDVERDVVDVRPTKARSLFYCDAPEFSSRVATSDVADIAGCSNGLRPRCGTSNFASSLLTSTTRSRSQQRNFRSRRTRGRGWIQSAAAVLICCRFPIRKPAAARPRQLRLAQVRAAARALPHSRRCRGPPRQRLRRRGQRARPRVRDRRPRAGSFEDCCASGTRFRGVESARCRET